MSEHPECAQAIEEKIRGGSNVNLLVAPVDEEVED